VLHLQHNTLQTLNKMENKKTLTFRPSKKNITMLAQLLQLAKKENRSLNNYIETVLLSWINSNPLNKKK